MLIDTGTPRTDHKSLPFSQCILFYREALTAAAEDGPDALHELRRRLCRTDLYFLLAMQLSTGKLMAHPWLFDRCREVEAAPDGYLDLWARSHFKSTIITFGITIQDILNDPEITVGILSNTRPIAKQFLRQIKNELETNKDLVALFPEILWAEPQKDAPKWSEDEGITVKRRGNPKEATIEAYGLVDGQPTSKHFTHIVYDDAVTQESVGTPEQINKTTAAWELSDNLGKEDGTTRKRVIGTRYHVFDTYKTMIDRGVVKVRTHPATSDGSMDCSKAVFVPPAALAEKLRVQGSYVFACQQLQNPLADTARGFREEWLRFCEVTRESAMATTNRYIIVDPASKKKTTSDYTTIWVIGTASDGNYYVLDCIHDRLNLAERGRAVMMMHRRWSEPGNMVSGVGYEEYGLQADVEYIESLMKAENYRFNITRLGGKIGKVDRIGRLFPIFESGRMWIPKILSRVNTKGEAKDLIREFLEDEYRVFPVCKHDDMLDCMARIIDAELGVKFPSPIAEGSGRWKDDSGYSQYQETGGGVDWMTV